MPENSYPTIRRLLASTEPEDLREGLELAKQEIAKTGPCEAEPLLEMVSGLFYIDPLDRPELMPLLDEAVSVVGGCGDMVIPVLVEKLDAGDLKAQFAVANALGRIGAGAIEPLMAEYNSSADPVRRTFVLYALGKIKSPKIVKAAHLALEAAQSADVELQDTATRAIGKFAESIPPSDLPEATFKLLQRAPELYQRQSHEERVRLLKVLLSNSVLMGGKLEPIYKKPFDLVAEGGHSGNWLPGEDSNLQPFG